MKHWPNVFTHLDAIICSLVLSEKLSHEPVCHFKYFPIVLDTKCAVWINRKGICMYGMYVGMYWYIAENYQSKPKASIKFLIHYWCLYEY